MGAPPSQPILLYRFALSGHAHRVELCLSLLGLPFRMIDVNLAKGEQRHPEYLRKNPFGQVPVIQDGDLTLADSNAIMLYLAGRYDPAERWLPRDPALAARIQRWFSVAAGALAHGPALLRVAAVFRKKLEPSVAEHARAVSTQLLQVLEAELALQPFLASSQPTLADLSMYTYTAHAPEGGVALDGYPNVRGWIERIEALPGFAPMQRFNVS